MELEEFDYIIVGGGTAGLVLTARLSETPSVKVLVLEAGDDQTSDPRVVTPALWSTLLNTPSDWAFKTVPQERLGSRQISFPQGRLLGGSSAINGMSYTANSGANVDAWARLGNKGWEWSNVSKYYHKAINVTAPSDATIERLQLNHIKDTAKSTNGPIQLSYPEEPDNKWAKAWLDTLGELGYASKGDPFSGQSYGGYINAETIDPKTRTRSFSGNAYLEAARSRENVKIITGATVNKIILEPVNGSTPTATGVQYVHGSETRTVHTKGEIVLSAGSFNTPRLLELSGVGSEEVLKKHNIPVIVNNPGVGEHLQNHLLVGLSFEVNSGEKTMDPLARQNPEALQAAMAAYGKQTGPFATGGTSASAQLPVPNNHLPEVAESLDKLLSTPSMNPPPISASKSFADVHSDFVHKILKDPMLASGTYITFPGYAAVGGDGSMLPPPPGEEGYFTVVTLLSHPLSLGSVHINSAGPDAALDIDPRYLSHPLDLEILARHLQFIEQKIVRSGSLNNMLKPNGKRTAGAPEDLKDLEVVKDYVKRAAVGAHHPTGTCAMMPREMGGVVDPELKVYGVQGLRICDASIVPLTPRNNPQATVYAVAEKGSELIRKQG